MTLRELGQSISEDWDEVKWFFVDMFKKIMNGDFLDLSLWQIGFLLIIIWAMWTSIREEYKVRRNTDPK
jgi:hypothetical protein